MAIEGTQHIVDGNGNNLDPAAPSGLSRRAIEERNDEEARREAAREDTDEQREIHREQREEAGVAEGDLS